MIKSPLSGVGEGGAYIDRTVDKVSFVIFLMKAQERRDPQRSDLLCVCLAQRKGTDESTEETPAMVDLYERRMPLILWRRTS